MDIESLLSEKVFIIAEAGINHNGSLKSAMDLVDAAKDSDADAVKFQTYKTGNLTAANTNPADYQKINTAFQSQSDMLMHYELTFSQFIKLKSYCDKKEIMFLSTPFDNESATFLNDIVPFFKVSSGDITNLPFLKFLVSMKKPLIISTGMAYMSEIEEVYSVLTKMNADFIFLYCVTEYPADYEDVNINSVAYLKKQFGRIGYSDHTKGIIAPLAAVALDAQIIEKHLTLDCNDDGPDHSASMEPKDFQVMVKSIRNLEKMRGYFEKKPTEAEIQMRNISMKSLVSVRDMTAGHIIKRNDVVIKRPGTGVAPKFIDAIVGKKCRNAIHADTPISYTDIYDNLPIDKHK